MLPGAGAGGKGRSVERRAMEGFGAAAADGSVELAGLQGYYDTPHGWLVHIDPSGTGTSTVLGSGHLGPVEVHGSGWVAAGLLDGKGALLHVDSGGKMSWTAAMRS
jgi:hypothetical protein